MSLHLKLVMHEFTVAHAQGYSFEYEHHGYASKIVQLVEERCVIIFVNRLFYRVDDNTHIEGVT